MLEADAWGHGATRVRDVLSGEGFGADHTGHGEPGSMTGSRAAPEPAAQVLSPEMLFGLPGGGRATPAMRLTGTVLSVKELRAGEGVSYGYAYRAPADTRVALVTGGYAQGLVRQLGGAVDVAIAGERHPIIGRVAMDVCVVEIGAADVRRGDDVLILGDPAREEPSLIEWVRASGLQASELITTVGLRAIREAAP
jgi:alanine racemase